MSRPVQCPACAGLGVGSSMFRCRVCKGRGLICVPADPGTPSNEPVQTDAFDERMEEELYV